MFFQGNNTYVTQNSLSHEVPGIEQVEPSRVNLLPLSPCSRSSRVSVYHTRSCLVLSYVRCLTIQFAIRRDLLLQSRFDMLVHALINTFEEDDHLYKVSFESPCISLGIK